MFFGEAPGDGGDSLALTVLVLDGTANDVQGGLRRRTHFGSVIRSTVWVLFAAGIGRRLRGGGRGAIRLRHMGRGRRGMGLGRLRGGWPGVLPRLSRRCLTLGCGFRGRGHVPDLGDDGADRRALPLGNHDLAQLAGCVRLDLDVGLVALDLDQGLAFLDILALFLEPAQDLARLHRVRQARHLNAGHGL